LPHHAVPCCSFCLCRSFFFPGFTVVSFPNSRWSLRSVFAKLVLFFVGVFDYPTNGFFLTLMHPETFCPFFPEHHSVVSSLLPPPVFLRTFTPRERHRGQLLIFGVSPFQFCFLVPPNFVSLLFLPHVIYLPVITILDSSGFLRHPPQTPQ